jgi:hypothetical protein
MFLVVAVRLVPMQPDAPNFWCFTSVLTAMAKQRATWAASAAAASHRAVMEGSFSFPPKKGNALPSGWEGKGVLGLPFALRAGAPVDPASIG